MKKNPKAEGKSLRRNKCHSSSRNHQNIIYKLPCRVVVTYRFAMFVFVTVICTSYSLSKAYLLFLPCFFAEIHFHYETVSSTGDSSVFGPRTRRADRTHKRHLIVIKGHLLMCNTVEIDEEMIRYGPATTCGRSVAAEDY